MVLKMKKWLINSQFELREASALRQTTARRLQALVATIMDKSLGTLLRFWGVFQFTQVQPLPSPHKQCWTRVSRFFS